MPDRDSWTAAMVLKWILIRDLPIVLAMAESYGAIEYSADGTKWPVVPEDIDAVIRAYCIDPELPPGQERNRTKVLRSQRVLAAQEEIYRALRCGDLEAQARRNGSGDVETIPPSQWLALKFRSLNGYDLAVPIAIDQEVLDLPRQVEDYLRGRVPVDVRPALWPDPLFAADQVTKYWRGAEQNYSQSDVVPSSEQANRSTSSAQRRCENWLRESGADELAKKPKTYWRSKATAKFAGLSHRGFNRAWGNVADEFPKIAKAGAKRKRNN